MSQTDYNQAKKVFRLAKCKTIEDYLKVYLKVNTGLLCDVFTVWRKTLPEPFKLDITHYVLLSSVTWDTFLLKSQVVLDSIYDPKSYDVLCKIKDSDLLWS